VREIAEALRGEGRDTFNLGGVDAAQAGLSRFKGGFGAERVELEAGSFSVGNPLQRMVASAADVALAGARRVLSRGS
jgi:lipid II:glycine glycyltransferase (peptidoglycan interpeptide bridge formation enzyme)